MLVDLLCSARVFKRFSRSIHYSTTKDLRHYVNFVIEKSITSAIGKEEIVGITKRDQELQKLIGCLEKTNNDPRDGDMRKYSSVFNKLAVVDGIVLRRERIVVPQDSKDYPRRKPRNCAYKAVAPRLRVVPWDGRNGRETCGKMPQLLVNHCL